MTLKKSRLEYKWVILITCFLMEFLCLGFCSSNVGLYTKAVTEALHIKRSIYSFGNSIRYIVQIVTALSFGVLVQRFGIKKMVVTTYLGMSLFLLILSLIKNRSGFIGNFRMGKKALLFAAASCILYFAFESAIILPVTNSR